MNGTKLFDAITVNVSTRRSQAAYSLEALLETWRAENFAMAGWHLASAAMDAPRLSRSHEQTIRGVGMAVAMNHAPSGMNVAELEGLVAWLRGA